MVWTFGHYITPEQAAKQSRGSTLAEYQAAAAGPPLPCENGCGNALWRYAGVGLCFPCATGTTDASEDYELR